MSNLGENLEMLRIRLGSLHLILLGGGTKSVVNERINIHSTLNLTALSGACGKKFFESE
jgi:hypothetical protein